MDTEKFKQKILDEIRVLIDSDAPVPQKDWDLICVLSAYEDDFGGMGNENKGRLDTALKVARQVAYVRTKKSFPQVLYVGTDVQNGNLKNIADDFSSQRNFPKQKLIILGNLGLGHTGDQIEEIPNHFSGNERRIVIISDAYHLPRIRRYLLGCQDKFNSKKIILYPSNPKKAPPEKVLEEIKKMQKYIKRGILPPER